MSFQTEQNVIESLHELLLKYFKDCTVDPLENKNCNTQYKCPQFDCPTNIMGNHSYNKLKLSVSFKKGKFKCWVCGYSGFIPKLAYDNFERSDLFLFKSFYGILFPDDFKQETEIESPLFNIRKYYEEQHFELLSEKTRKTDVYKKSIDAYAKKRGLSAEIIEFYNLCFAREGAFKNCLVIPSFDKHGNINYFVGRKINKDFKKFVNPPCPSQDIIFNECYITWKEELLIVEGPIDYTATLGNRTCLLTSTLSQHSLLFQKILEHNTSVKLLLDNDAQDRTKKIETLLISRGIKTKVISNILDEIGIKDPGELLKIDNREIILQKYRI